MMQRPIYEILERGVYRPNYIPRGRSSSIPGTPNYNAAGFIPIHYNFFTTAATSVRVLEQSDRRAFLQIQNDSGASDIFVAFGKQASANDGIRLTPGQVEIFDVKVPTEFLEIFCAASGQLVRIVEGI